MEKYLKKAASKVNTKLMLKTAGIRAQMFADLPATVAGGWVGGPSAMVAMPAVHAAGSAAGALKDEPDLKRMVELDEKPWYKSLLPGFNHSDMMERLRFQTKGTTEGRKHIIAENYGWMLRPLAASIVGGLLGRSWNAAAAAGSLASIGEGGAALLAGLTKTRTADEQRDVDNSGSLLAMLTPKGTYDFWKRRGRLIEEADKREALRKIKA